MCPGEGMVAAEIVARTEEQVIVALEVEHMVCHVWLRQPNWPGWQARVFVCIIR